MEIHRTSVSAKYSGLLLVLGIALDQSDDVSVSTT